MFVAAGRARGLASHDLQVGPDCNFDMPQAEMWALTAGSETVSSKLYVYNTYTYVFTYVGDTGHNLVLMKRNPVSGTLYAITAGENKDVGGCSNCIFTVTPGTAQVTLVGRPSPLQQGDRGITAMTFMTNGQAIVYWSLISRFQRLRLDTLTMMDYGFVPEASIEAGLYTGPSNRVFVVAQTGLVKAYDQPFWEDIGDLKGNDCGLREPCTGAGGAAALWKLRGDQVSSGGAEVLIGLNGCGGGGGDYILAARVDVLTQAVRIVRLWGPMPLPLAFLTYKGPADETTTSTGTASTSTESTTTTVTHTSWTYTSITHSTTTSTATTSTRSTSTASTTTASTATTRTTTTDSTTLTMTSTTTATGTTITATTTETATHTRTSTTTLLCNGSLALTMSGSRATDCPEVMGEGQRCEVACGAAAAIGSFFCVRGALRHLSLCPEPGQTTERVDKVVGSLRLEAAACPSQEVLERSFRAVLALEQESFHYLACAPLAASRRLGAGVRGLQASVQLLVDYELLANVSTRDALMQKAEDLGEPGSTMQDYLLGALAVLGAPASSARAAQEPSLLPDVQILRDTSGKVIGREAPAPGPSPSPQEPVEAEPTDELVIFAIAFSILIILLVGCCFALALRHRRLKRLELDADPGDGVDSGSSSLYDLPPLEASDEVITPAGSPEPTHRSSNRGSERGSSPVGSRSTSRRRVDEI